MTNDEDFPFKNEDILKIETSKNRMVLSKPAWWELLDWSKMPDAFDRLPLGTKKKIRRAGLV